VAGNNHGFARMLAIDRPSDIACPTFRYDFYVHT
jgi:hypothetical protein